MARAAFSRATCTGTSKYTSSPQVSAEDVIGSAARIAFAVGVSRSSASNVTVTNSKRMCVIESSRQRHQRRFVDGFGGGLLHDQGHRGNVVVADDPDQVHDTAFAEFGEGRLERRVTDVLVAIELGAEIIERGFIL